MCQNLNFDNGNCLEENEEFELKNYHLNFEIKYENEKKIIKSNLNIFSEMKKKEKNINTIIV